MTGQRPPRPEPASKRDASRDRLELLDHLQAILEPAMTALGFLFLGLLLVDYGLLDLGDAGRRRVGDALQVIWVVFLVEFGVRFTIAPAKLAFLRGNWLSALSLALPFLRPLRVFRAARALRSFSLVRLIGGLNRGMRVLRQVTRGRQFAYVGALTVVVVLAAAVGVLSFDRDAEGATIRTFGDALWWSAALVTTINNEKYAVSAEARVIAILVRIFAVSVFGYVTASIATYLLGARAADDGETARLREENAALRRELDAVSAASGAAESLVEEDDETRRPTVHP